MSLRGHNGGPPIVDDDEGGGEIRMRYARIHISDLLQGVRELPLDERGFYMTALFVMYDKMGSLPADDRAAAIAIGCDIRTYRRLREKMVGIGKFHDTGAGFSNKRVQDEITAYCKEVRNRRKAASEREEAKRVANDVVDTTRPTSAGSRTEVGRKSAGSSAEVRPTSDGSLPDLTEHLFEKTSKNNECAPTTAPQPSDNLCSYAGASLKRKHKQEEESEEKRESSFAAGAAPHDDLVGVVVASEAEIEALTVGAACAQPNDDAPDNQFMPMSALAGHVVHPVEEAKPATTAVACPQIAPSEVIETVAEVIAPRRMSSNDSLEAFQAYNDLAQRIGLSVARSLTPARRRALEARLREHGGLPAWAQILANVERSAFLRGMGGGRPGWRADLDFLLQAKSCAKVFDGGYGNGAHGAAAGETAIERTMRLCEEAADRLGISKGGLL